MDARGKVPVLVNRAAVGAARVRPALAAAGVDALVDVADCSADDVGRRVALAAAGAAPIIAVAGGDGTHMSAAQELIGTASALLPLPAGTLNHFAVRSGSDSLESAARLLSSGRVAARPVGILDDVVFLNTAIIGAYPAVVRRRDRLRRVLPKWPAALLAFCIAGVRRPRRIRVVLEGDDGRLERVTTMIWIGLGRGSYPLPHEADGHAGTLEVAILRDLNRVRIAAFLVRLVRHATRPDAGRPTRDVELFHTRRLLVHADRPIDATLDGEPRRFRSPVFIALQSGALRVVVPDAGRIDPSAAAPT